jgi:hypothetical protein
MSDRIKSMSEQKIEKALNMGPKSADDLSDLDEDSNDPSEDTQAKIDAKNDQLKRIKERFDGLKDLDDKEFSRQMYRQLALDSVELFHISKAEMEIDPSPRYVEVATQAASTAKALLDGLREIEIVDKKFEIEDKKLAVKENAGPNAVTNNIAFVGSLQDALKQIDSALNQSKTIEAKAEVIKKE